jgi:hypothetical protein
MTRTADRAWARHCIMFIVMVMLVAASGLGSVAHALAECHNSVSSSDSGPVEVHDHGQGHHNVATYNPSSDTEPPAHAECCSHLCQAMDTSHAAAFPTPPFIARLFTVMLDGLGPSAPRRSMERPPSRTAEL